ncbi:GD21615 [Drosophila simulans]|uniref:GD21615 n=1 Tax=Drosophila simulans TaxID=7240 RepID=B4Q4W8_DROSI|nr:GD21615 [Drosophila simulans]
MADGRYEEVTSMIEVNIGLGESIVRMQLLILTSLGSVKGTSTVAVRRITMKDDQPVKQRYYPKNPKMQVEINAKVDELLERLYYGVLPRVSWLITI